MNKIFHAAGGDPPKISAVRPQFIKRVLSQQPKQLNIKEQGGVKADSLPPLRAHQRKAMDKIEKAVLQGVRGRIVLATGTGKTRIEAEIIVHLHKNHNATGVCVILAPRILLTYQLLSVVGRIVAAHGVEFECLNVNSGEFDSQQLEKYILQLGMEPSQVESTTSVDDIGGAMIGAAKRGKPLLIFSTYHSASQVVAASEKTGIPIEVFINDEAQYCVTAGVFQEVPHYPSKYGPFFFTATEKHTDDPEHGIGMNNENIFGKILYTEKPKTLISKGEMTSVAIHLIGAKEEINEDNYESKARLVVEAFNEHRDVLKRHSVSPDDIGPKMLVVCERTRFIAGNDVVQNVEKVSGKAPPCQDLRFVLGFWNSN